MFMIEFAVVGLFMSLLIVFSGDVIIKLSTQGKLDRLSFSAASILKERTQLYNGEFVMLGSEADAMHTIISASLGRSMGNFDAASLGVRIEEQTYNSDNTPKGLVTYLRGSQTCAVDETLSNLQGDLAVVTTWGRMSSLYRVTICYETDNMIGDLLGLDYTTVTSSSVLVGR
ncbi:ATP-binding protein [Vibrio sp. SCSIO 43136]|nr:ATP-binding protein [Vibrio sp. SCSIO 43136]